MTKTLLFISIAFAFAGCFGRFVMTEKELKKYYTNKPEPAYFTVHNDSVRLFCATTGADTLPPLLLIHGAPGAWYGSRNFLSDSALHQHYHIIAVDWPGYNKSRFNNKRKAVTSITTQAIAIHEALQLNHSQKPGVVLGSSYGAPIAAKMTVLYPEAFHHLVMLAPAIDPQKEKFWWFHPFVHHGPIRWFLPRFMNHATDEKFAHTAELKKMLPDWAKINIRVTVVQGASDNIVNPANLDFAKKMLQGRQAEFILLPHTGHLIRFEKPEMVKAILLKQASVANIH